MGSHFRRYPPARSARRAGLHLLGLLLWLAASLTTPAPVLAATITVTTTADSTTNDGLCSLREAIIAANLNAASGGAPGECPAGSASGIDTIVLAPGATYALTSSSPHAVYGATGLPLITSQITIQGNGSTIRRAAGAFRIMRVTAAGVLTLDRVTIRNGMTESGPGIESNGGGIYNEGTLSLNNSLVTLNQAFSSGTSANVLNAFGGGIFSRGTLTLVGTAVSQNFVTVTQLGSGSAVSQGGGVFISSGRLTATDSSLSNNEISSAAASELSNAAGGALAASGNTIITIANSSLNGNLVVAENNLRGGALFAVGAFVTVTGSTFATNQVFGELATTSGGGGAIAVTSGTVTVANSTITGNTTNSATVGGGLLAALGGGFRLINVTVTNNDAPAGGGLSHNGTGTTRLLNTLIAGNRAQGLLTNSVADCEQISPITSDGYNLTGQGRGCPNGPTDLTVVSSTVATTVLNTLASNGGLTQTHALRAGSPAIDAGSNTACAATPVSGVDQRGQARPTDGTGDGLSRCDIGAFEAATVPSVSAGATAWYFAEGYTGPDFDEYLTIQNPNASAANVTITYFLTGAPPVIKSFTVPANSRDTVVVHEEARGVGRNSGLGWAVSAKVESTNGVGIIVERPMYFRYRGSMGTVSGGHNVMGVQAPRQEWYFAEGYTGPGFDEYLTIMNPNSSAADVTLTYFLTGAPPITRTATIPANARFTVPVHETTLGVGRNQAVAARVTTSHADGIVVERPMYFRYRGSMGSIGEGHNVMGARAPNQSWYFPDGSSASGIDQYLTIMNTTTDTIAATLTYFVVGEATPRTIPISVPPNSRKTVLTFVPGEGVERGKQFATSLTTTHPVGLVVERPVYFANGAHNVMGAPNTSQVWYFSEGYTGPGFNESLVILNPASLSARVAITYVLTGQPPVVKEISVTPFGRATVNVNGTSQGVGPNQAVSAKVESLNGALIAVERPMVFTYSGAIVGAHTVMGFTP